MIKEELLWYPPREDPAGRVEDHMYEGRAVFSIVVSYVPDTVKKPKEKLFSMRPGLWLSMHCRFTWQTTSSALNFHYPCGINTMASG